MMTSDPPDDPRILRRTALVVYGSWVILSLLALFWIYRYTHDSPLIDEWEFVPALVGEERIGPWLWKQHNEHRFPLPRILYFALFQLTHDFRTGCYVSWLGTTLLTFGMIQLAKRLRGKLHWADAFFPLTILHLGHFENFRMGYQICFMLIAVLSACVLACLVTLRKENQTSRSILAGIFVLLLMGCGASGLAYGPPMACFLVVLAVSSLIQTCGRAWRSALVQILLAGCMPLFILIYFQDYVRPVWHPPSPGIIPAIRIGLQAFSMAFGVAITGLWPVSAFLVVLLGLETTLRLLRVIGFDSEERLRGFGVFCYLGAIGILGMGIGWGRSGFGEEANMGLAARYSWLMMPALFAIYFVWLLYGGTRPSSRVPSALCLGMLALLPFNTGTGFVEGEKRLAHMAAWDRCVQDGMSDQALVERFHSEDSPYFQVEIIKALRLLRTNGLSSFVPLKKPNPRGSPRRRIRRSRSSH